MSKATQGRRREIAVTLILCLFVALATTAEDGPPVLLGKVAPCDFKRHPGCPDMAGLVPLSDGNRLPSPGFYREVYSPALRRNVAEFWFKPVYAETDDDKLRSQAADLLQKLRPQLRRQTDLVLGRPVWIGSDFIRIDAYLFIKDSRGQWHRNKSGELVDQLIRTGFGADDFLELSTPSQGT